MPRSRERIQLIPIDQPTLEQFVGEVATAYLYYTGRQSLPLMPTPENIALSQKYRTVLTRFFDLNLQALRTPKLMHALLGRYSRIRIWHEPEARIDSPLIVRLGKFTPGPEYVLSHYGSTTSVDPDSHYSRHLSLEEFKSSYLNSPEIDDEEKPKWEFKTEEEVTYTRGSNPMKYTHHHAYKKLEPVDFLSHPHIVSPFVKGITHSLRDLRGGLMKKITPNGEDSEVVEMIEWYTEATKSLEQHLP